MRTAPKYSKSKHFSALLALLLCTLLLMFQNCGESFSKFDLENINGNSSLSETKVCAIGNPSPNLLQDTCYKSFDSEYYSNFETYEPQFPLFTDGAQKKRWIYLPNGSQIDSSDVDQWVFPKGSILWKEFSLNGKKIETRMWEKINTGVGVHNWRPSVYVWTSDQSKAVQTVTGIPPDDGEIYAISELSFPYQVPSKNQCIECHQGAGDGILGFDYLQLSDPTKPGNLNRWKQSGHFLNPPANMANIPGNSEDKFAVGYFHGNCSSCHSPNGSQAAKGMFLKFNSQAQTLNDLPTLTTTATNNRIVPGDCASSLIPTRLANGTMPPFGTFTDDDSIDRICLWIDNLNGL